MSDIAVKRRFGTTSEINARTLPSGECEIDISKYVWVIHNGTNAGGVPMAREVHSHSNVTTSVSGFMSAADKGKLDGLSSVGGYGTIENNATALTQQSILNFSNDFIVTDNNASTRTDVVISASFRAEMLTQSIALNLIFGD